MEIYDSRQKCGFVMNAGVPTRIPTTVNKVAMTALQHILTPSFINVDMFDLLVPYLFFV